MSAVSFLTITQNIGSIDCSQIKNEITPEVRSKTDQFLRSLSEFIRAAAKAKQDVAAVPSPERTPTDELTPTSSSNRSKVEEQVKGSVLETGAGALGGDAELEVDVVVLHLQEIGGKKHNLLFNDFLGAEIMKTVWPTAGWCSGLLMQPQNCDSTFTAMGVVIFLSHRVVPISSILSVRHRTYVAIADDPVTYAGGCSSLFFGGKFSNAEKSRKGFLLTSLRIGTTCINFVNLHLYHDADNSTAVAESPSRYAPRRVEAFLEAMAEVVPVVNGDDPLFVFGDFNTRLDAKRLVTHLTRRFDLEEGVIKMGKKEVTAPDCVWSYIASPETRSELQQFDLEPRMLMDALADQSGIELCELAVQFPPSYMLDDSKVSGVSDDVKCFAKRKIRPYKRERLPAWCDRLFMNVPALELMTGTAGSEARKRTRKQNEGSATRRSHVTLESAFTEPPEGEAVTKQEARIDGANASTDSSRCVYESVSLECMDHEAVFLLF